MNPRTARVIEIGKAVLHEVRAERLTFMAGSIAYHAFVSLLPLLLLFLAVIAAIGDQSMQESFISLTSTVLTAGASEVLVSELRAASTGVSLVGGLVLLWGTLRIFRGLDTAFSDIYESEAENTFGDQLRDGILVLVAFGVAVAVAVVVESTLSLDGDGLGLWLARRLVLVAGLALALFPIYYVFPDDGVSAVEVVPGVLVAAVGLTLFESLFQVYVAYKSGGGTGGGLLAGVLVLLTWLYFSGLVVLLGAAVNAVLSNRSRDVDIDPVFGGIARGGRQGLPDRAELGTAVEHVAARLRGADEVSVTVDGEPYDLPAPEVVVADVGGSPLVPGGGVSLELRWSPREPELDGGDHRVRGGESGDDDGEPKANTGSATDDSRWHRDPNGGGRASGPD